MENKIHRLGFDEKPEVPDQHKHRGRCRKCTTGSTEGIIILGASFCVNVLGIGYLYSMSIILVDVLHSLETDRASTSLMVSLSVGVVYSGALVMEPVVSRLKPGRSIMLGGLLSLVGCVGAFFATNVPVLGVTLGLITGSGLCISHFSTFVAVSNVFDKNSGLGFSVITAGSGVGGFLFPILNADLISRFGWQGCVLITGSLLFQMCLFGSIIKTFTPNRMLKSDRSEDASKESCARRYQFDILKNSIYTILLTLMLPVWLLMDGVVIFLPDAVTERGYDADNVSYLLACCNFATVAGTIGGGILQSRQKCPSLLLVSVAIILAALTSLCFVYCNAYWLYMVLYILLGFAIGIFDIGATLSIHDISGKAAYSRAMSIYFGTSGFVNIASGPVAGALRDMTGQYDALFYTSTAIGCVSGIGCIVLYIVNRKKIQQTLSAGDGIDENVQPSAGEQSIQLLE